MLNFQGAVHQDSVLLTHAPPLGWVSFPRKTWVSFNYKSIEIDSDIMVDLKKQDEDYANMCQELGEMESRYPFVLEVTEGSGAISLTAEEHEIVRRYMSRMFEKETIERCQIYFRGHTDGYAYLKKIGAI